MKKKVLKKREINLFNIIEDPYEQNDLSERESEVFERMKLTISSIVERDVVGDMNPAHAYLHGDDRQGGIPLGSAWLDGDYEFTKPPSLIASIFITIWIMILAFKEYLFLILLVILMPIIYFKFIRK